MHPLGQRTMSLRYYAGSSDPLSGSRSQLSCPALSGHLVQTALLCPVDCPDFRNRCFPHRAPTNGESLGGAIASRSASGQTFRVLYTSMAPNTVLLNSFSFLMVTLLTEPHQASCQEQSHAQHVTYAHPTRSPRQHTRRACARLNSRRCPRGRSCLTGRSPSCCKAHSTRAGLAG